MLRDDDVPSSPHSQLFTPHSLRSLFIVIVSGKAVPLDEFVPLRRIQVFPDHFRDELRKSDPRDPAELLLRLGRVAQQRLDFGRPEIAGIDGDYR